MSRCTEQALGHYERIIEQHDRETVRDESLWSQALRQVETEWEILKNIEAVAESIFRILRGLNRRVH